MNKHENILITLIIMLSCIVITLIIILAGYSKSNTNLEGYCVGESCPDTLEVGVKNDSIPELDISPKVEEEPVSSSITNYMPIVVLVGTVIIAVIGASIWIIYKKQ